MAAYSIESALRLSAAVADVRDFNNAARSNAIDDAEHRHDRASVAGKWTDQRCAKVGKLFQNSQSTDDSAEHRFVNLIEVFLRLRKQNDFHRRARRFT